MRQPFRASHRFEGTPSSRDLALRTHPLVVGVMVFLASELMLFGAMLASYYDLRQLAAVWPPPDVHLDVGAASVGTALLAVSSATMLMTTHNLARGRFRIARLWLGTTIALGTAFLLIAIHGWLKNTFSVDSNAYGSIFYMLTGIHALHVLVGMILMTGWFFNIDAAAFERDERAGAESIGLYWHFVFGVWVLIFGSIYLVR